MATTVLSSRTTFLEALIVPDLVQACIRVLDLQRYRTVPGRGLKKLRLICQGARDAVWQEVQGFDFRPRIGDKQQLHAARMVEFFRHSNLLRLQISMYYPETATGKHACVDRLYALNVAMSCTEMSPIWPSYRCMTLSMALAKVEIMMLLNTSLTLASQKPRWKFP